MADIITVEQMQNASTDCQTLSDVISGAPDTQVRSRLGRMIWTIATVNSKIESVRVASDNAKTTIASYVTSVEQTKTQAQTDINKKVADVYGGYFAAFDTLANLQASTGAKSGQVAKVMNDPTASNNGDYRYNGSAWVKGYDVLTDAKAYTDSRTAYTYEYINGNMIGAKTAKYINLGVDVNYSITLNDTRFDSVVIPVYEGDTLYLLNDKQSYDFGQGYGFAFFSDNPNVNRTQKSISAAVATLTDASTSLVYKKITVPVGAKYLMLNVRFNSTTWSWSVNRDAFSSSYASGTEMVGSINNTPTLTLPRVMNVVTPLLPTYDYIYDGTNMVGSKSKKLYGIVYGDKRFNDNTAWESIIIPVAPNDTLYLQNSKNTYTYSSGYSYGFFDAIPSNGTARLSNVSSTFTDASTGLNYLKVTVPSNAKYLVINTKFNDVAQWNVNKTGFSNSYTQGREVITAINNAAIADANPAIKFDLTQRYVDGNEMYNAQQYTNLGVAYDLKIADNGLYDAAVLEVTQNDVLYFLNDLQKYEPWADGTSFAFYAENPIINKTQSNIADNRVITTDAASNLKYAFATVPTGANYCLITTRFVTYDGTILKPSWTVHKNKFSNSYDKGVLKNVKLNGVKFYTDEKPYLLSKYDGKKVYCFGDSITQGTRDGSWVPYLTQKLGCIVSNQGSGGGNAARVVDIITYGYDLPRRSGDINFGKNDYTDAAAITIQIGTNDYISGSKADIPTGNVTDYANELDYWALFPNNYYANISLAIEFIRSKNKMCDIYLISIPYRRSDATLTETYKQETIDIMREIANYYSVQFINARQESGLGWKYMTPDDKWYSYDGTHLNSAGNKKWGEYIAKRMLDTMH